MEHGQSDSAWRDLVFRRRGLTVLVFGQLSLKLRDHGIPQLGGRIIAALPLRDFKFMLGLF